MSHEQSYCATVSCLWLPLRWRKDGRQRGPAAERFEFAIGIGSLATPRRTFLYFLLAPLSISRELFGSRSRPFCRSVSSPVVCSTVPCMSGLQSRCCSLQRCTYPRQEPERWTLNVEWTYSTVYRKNPLTVKLPINSSDVSLWYTVQYLWGHF